MKLKKITSLALAGVMAVSMLAGCSGKGDANGDNGNDNPVVTPSTTSIIKALNDGQSASNDVKVDFKVDSELDAALAKAVSVYGNDATDAEIMSAITMLTGVKSHHATDDDKIILDVDKDTGFLTGDRPYFEKDNNKGESMDGKVYTVIGIASVDALSEEAALNQIADVADGDIAELAKTGMNSAGDEPETGDKYFSYSYDGNASMVSVKNLDGSTTYWVVYIVNQNVAVKTL